MVHLRAGASIEQLKSLSKVTFADMFVPAVELSDLTVSWPLHETNCEILKVLSVHVPFLPLENVILAEKESPSPATLAVISDVGHWVLVPVASLVRTVLPTVPSVTAEIPLAPAGVTVAWAVLVATANTLSMAALSSRLRILELFTERPR